MSENEYQSLLPKDNIDLGDYRDALDFAMDHSEIRNIALAGSYGSGKSSVIRTYEKERKEKRFLHISLANYSGDIAESDKKSLINVLERKILNQLLHQIEPEKIKKSQFRTIQDEAPWEKPTIVAFITVFVLLLLYVIRFESWKAFVGTLPPGRLDISWTALPSLRVVALLFCFIMGGVALWRFLQGHDLQRLFKKIDVKGIFGVEVFDRPEDAFFDKYLNEVLYLFEHSGADAIVFEDLDRYEVREIFEKLKEVSDLLYQRWERNGSKVDTIKVLKFFYLIRDDVFSCSDRSKFFDFIIPVVPIVSTDNAYDLIQERVPKDKFESRFLRTVSLYLSDVRLINNIVNEYNIYEKRIGNSDLHRDNNRQLAIIVYKNLFPKDFEQLQRGAGYVYALFKKRESLIESQRDDITQEIQEIKEQLEQIQQECVQNIDELNALFCPRSNNVVSIDGQDVGLNLSRVELVRSLLAAKKASYRTNSGSGSIDIKDLRDEMERNQDYQRRKNAVLAQSEHRQNSLNARLSELDEEFQILSTKKLHELIYDDDFWLLNDQNNGTENDFSYIVNSKEFGLIKFLIGNGYIDEDYSIYISYYYPNSLTVQDKNFVLAVTSQKRPDYYYHLDSPTLVLEWLDNSYFTLESIENFDLFNYILRSERRDILKIWLGALRRWSDSDETAYIFPVELWKSTPYRKILVQAINSNAPDWFENWTILGNVLNDDEWHQFAVETLTYSNAKVLRKMNQQCWLTKAISQRADFPQIDNPEIDTVINAFHTLGVQFTSVSWREQDIPLVTRIYQENLYCLNAQMLGLWLTMFYMRPQTDALKDSYTWLYAHPDEPLSHRVEENFEEYIDVILNQNDSDFYDKPEAVLHFLNHEKTDVDSGEAYIQRLHTDVYELNQVDKKELWPILLDRNLVVHRWENVVCYYMEYCSGKNPLDDHIIDYLQRNSGSIMWEWNALAEPIGTDETNVLYRKLIQCTKLSLDSYQAILEPIGASYTAFSIKDIPDEYMTVVIRLGIIKVTAENIKFMRTTYPEKVIDFLLQDGGDAFVDLIENSSMSVEKAELVGLLEDKRTERSAAVRLIDSYNGPISIADKKYPEAIQVKIIEDSYDVKDTNWLLNHYDQQTTTVQEAFIRHVQTHPDELTNVY